MTGSTTSEIVETAVVKIAVMSVGAAVVAISDGKSDVASLARSRSDVGDPSKADATFEASVSTESKADEIEGKPDVKVSTAEVSCPAEVSTGPRSEVIDASSDVTPVNS